VASGDERTSALIEAYEQTPFRWGEVQSDSSAANDVFEDNHSIYKRLRNHEEGRLAVARLMEHESEAVRLLAATHSLAWRRDEATAVLEGLIESGGLHGLTAKYTLKSFREGKLNLDW
jgi:hypothetical protein